MFAVIRMYLYMMRVQAELKGQHNEQAFVNLVCHRPATIEDLRTLREEAYFRTDKIAPFMGVCRVLSNALTDLDLPFDARRTSASLLAQRLIRIGNDPQFRLRHLMIFGELEEKLRDWMEANPQELAGAM